MSTALLFGMFGLSGIASGFCAGLFGIGGGLIMVPVLVYAFKATGMAPEHVVAMALGTSMAAIVFSSAQSAYGHYRKGSASVEKVRFAAPWGRHRGLDRLCDSGANTNASSAHFVGSF